MRKIIFAITMGLLLTACDPGSNCSVYVKNNCSDTVCVITTKEYSDNRPTGTKNTHIAPNENMLIHKDLILSTPPELDFIRLYFFSTITIIKGNNASKRDFMNPQLWELTTNKKGSNYDAKFNLTVNPKDFE